jgi:chromosome segregation ATPase
MIQQRGESIKRQNEELGILRKRNAELCSENVTITKAIREIVGQFKSLKERQEEATQELRTDLAETRAKHDGVTQQMDAMQQQHQEANKAHAFSLDVVTGLRHTLSWQKNKNWKLQKECDEINHRHAEKYTKSEDLIQKAKENLLHSHASEATLREETERLQGELDDSVLVAEGLQLELDDERATCGRLRDEVQRLEAEVKTLLARTESAEAPTQLPVNGRRLQSLPPLLHSSIAPFLGSSKGFLPVMRYFDNSLHCSL